MTNSQQRTDDQQRMYKDLAWLWPIISPPEDYEGEAEEFAAVIRQMARRPVTTLLDLGCGGGHNDFTLKRHFLVSGVDLNDAMLALARALNPEIAYTRGDMRTVRLGQLFDAVIIADAIDYMLSEDDLQAAFQTAFDHLAPGGVFVTYAELTCENFRQNENYITTAKQADLEITLLRNHYDPNPNDTTLEFTFVYLIRRAGQLSLETDRHLAGLFPLATWQRLLANIGFEVYVLQNQFGDPLFAAVKPLL